MGNPTERDNNRSSSAFWQLHETVRRWIWEQHWIELRDIQEQSIGPILAGNTDLIVAAATARGKTEAAFLPIFSCLADDLEGSAVKGIQALYISPLKALINDQYRRLSALGDYLQIPVHPWHGDIAASRKRSLLKHPAGILLITPESLEALFIRYGPQMVRLFSPLKYVVVDELHSFIGSERGRQLQCLLHRLELAVRRIVPRIGLSATLGDMALAADFLRPGQAQAVLSIQSSEAGQEIKLQLRGYRQRSPFLQLDGLDLDDRNSTLHPEAMGRQTPEIADPETRQATESDQRPTDNIAAHLFKVLRGEKHLIFINSRQDVERYADLLRRHCEDLHVPNEFFPHHGSLAKELRQEAETALKQTNRPASAVCTTTLEMGIDIGAVASIAQIGAPHSVASTRQRLGRSGRRQGDAAILRLYLAEPEVTAQTPPEKSLHPPLLQAIAVINLLLQGWYEPPSIGQLHLSTLIQQLLSLIAQHGGVRPDQSWQVLCQTGPFRTVDQTLYMQLLRSLGACDLLQQSQDGLLLLGMAGERLVNHYSFYTAFATPEEYRIIGHGKTLGTLPIAYPLIEGMFIIFAGQRWQVLAVDEERRVVDVTQATAGRVPYFGGEGLLLHDRIRQEMFQLYTTCEVPMYLDDMACELLCEARDQFARYGLEESYCLLDGDQTLLFLWRGSLVSNTIFVQLLARGLRVDRGAIALTIRNTSPAQLLGHLRAIAQQGTADAIALAATVRNKRSEKHDRFLNEELLCRNYAARALDTQGAWETICQIVGHA